MICGDNAAQSTWLPRPVSPPLRRDLHCWQRTDEQRSMGDLISWASLLKCSTDRSNVWFATVTANEGWLSSMSRTHVLLPPDETPPPAVATLLALPSQAEHDGAPTTALCSLEPLVLLPLIPASSLTVMPPGKSSSASSGPRKEEIHT